MKLDRYILAVICSVLLAACSLGIEVDQKEGFTPRIEPQTVYVFPFTTVMVPGAVAEGLFDRFVDQLNEMQTQDQLEYVILKQGLDGIDPVWLNKRDYVTGEIFAYVEEIGSTTASIRAKSRIRLYQGGQAEPTLRLDYPVEVFYEKDYTSLAEARRQLAEKISGSMAQKLGDALTGRGK